MTHDIEGDLPDTAHDVLLRSSDPSFIMHPVRDGSGTIVELVYSFLNDAALRLYDMSREDVLGKGLLELFPSARENGIFDADVRAIDTQDQVETTVPWVDENGVQGAFTLRAVPHEAGVLVTAVDVTATMLAESNLRHQLIAEASSDLVYRRSPDGVVEWVSPSVTHILGWSPDEFVGVDLHDLIHPDDVAAMETVQPTAEQSGAAPGPVEMRFATADGGWRWMSAFAHNIRNRPAGVIGAVDTLRDVQSEVEARETFELTVLDLNAAQRMAGLASWRWEPATDRVAWSRKMFELFGLDPTLPPPDFAAQAKLYGTASFDRMNEAMAELLDTGAPYDLEIEFFHTRSGRGWMRTWGEAVRDDRGVIVEVRGYAQSITDQVEARRRLERSDHTLRATQRMARLGSWELDIATGQPQWSDELYELFGLDPEFPPPTYDESSHLYGSESWERVTTAVSETGRTGVPFLLEAEIIRSNATRRWVEVRAEAIRDTRDVIVGLRGFLMDITGRREAERALASSESLFRTAMLASPIGMAMIEIDGSFRVVNESLCELLGRDEAWLTEHTIRDVADPDDLQLLEPNWQAVIDDEPATEFEPLRFVHAEHRILRVKLAAELVVDAVGRPDYLLVQFVDTTAEHAALVKLAYQATHDPLTGLHNRTGIMDLLEADLRDAPGLDQQVAVLFIDLDNFKIVNDSLGHAAGDEVLCTVADRIDRTLQPGDRFGRSGGDEFIVVVPEVAESGRAERVAEDIVSAVGTEMMIRGHRIVPTVSIGVALSESGSTSTSLLRDADAALFRAKEAGRSRWQVFDDAMHSQALGRLTIEGDVRRGLGADEFVVHYQPIVSLADRRVVGHEALVRWEHPERGLLSPAHFLETAEDSGLIVNIGQCVLDQVCDLLESRPDLPGPISVNFSPVQLAHADWLRVFTNTVERCGVDPRRIVIEVTETAVMTLLPGTHGQLLALRDLGVGIHVDDFGTGFSSISLLRDMPVTGLKLDKSFVADLNDDDAAANALSTGLAGLVNGLHLTGIAEGVEFESQHRTLLGQGWSHAQGYLYGRPSPQPIVTIPTAAE